MTLSNDDIVRRFIELEKRVKELEQREVTVVTEVDGKKLAQEVVKHLPDTVATMGVRP